MKHLWGGEGRDGGLMIDCGSFWPNSRSVLGLMIHLGKVKTFSVLEWELSPCSDKL